jgi:hypothetical protein
MNSGTVTELDVDACCCASREMDAIAFLIVDEVRIACGVRRIGMMPEERMIFRQDRITRCATRSKTDASS